MFGSMEELFDLPLQTKQRNMSEKPLYGYIGQSPVVPLYESMGIDDADVAAKVDAFTEKQWPQGNKSFRSVNSSYILNLFELVLNETLILCYYQHNDSFVFREVIRARHNCEKNDHGELWTHEIHR